MKLAGKAWAALVVALGFSVFANGAVVDLTAVADGSSAYYEYYSDAFAQIDLRDPPPNDFRQRFHQISNPAVSFGGLDLFPHDSAMQFGTLSYDDAAIVGGEGVATILALSLGITADPNNSAYLNWQRFTMSTIVDSFSGTVTVHEGLLTSIDLNASVTLHGASILGSTIAGDYAGTFSTTGSLFVLNVEGSPVLDTIFSPAGAPVHLAWNFTGTLTAVAVPEVSPLLLASTSAVALAIIHRRAKARREVVSDAMA